MLKSQYVTSSAHGGGLSVINVAFLQFCLSKVLFRVIDVSG